MGRGPERSPPRPTDWAGNAEAAPGRKGMYTRALARERQAAAAGVGVGGTCMLVYLLTPVYLFIYLFDCSLTLREKGQHAAAMKACMHAYSDYIPIYIHSSWQPAVGARAEVRYGDVNVAEECRPRMDRWTTVAAAAVADHPFRSSQWSIGGLLGWSVHVLIRKVKLRCRPSYV
ncbi:hypothetical protein GGR56DRAFT_633458 [Xylariaceae sp. FL0804]|nr:hypothetical protein GGR56DRAFT_633458 [Xylariaceae sp. FL0804]